MTPAYTQLLAALRNARSYRSGRADIAQSHRACCPAHDDKSPSLSVALTHDGRILVHCHAGCAAGDVLAAAGLSIVDAAPDAAGDYAPGPGPSAWGSIAAATDAAENAIWRHLLAPSIETAESALYVIEQLRRASKTVLRAAARGGAAC